MNMERRGEWVMLHSSFVALPTNFFLPPQMQDPIMKGEVVHDIHKDDDTQLDLVWMGSAITKGSGTFGMDLALLRCCRRIDDKRFAIVSRR
jgi:hypothetical protein